jgi:ABC-type transporter Mla MlaB component
MSPEPATKRTPFTIERKEGKAPGTVIFRFCGPFTARDMYASLAPITLDNFLNFKSIPDEVQPALNILDLTDVPYVDSSGLGMIIRHHVRCQGRGIRFVVAGSGPRVLDLFKMTRVDSVLATALSVDESESL